MYTINFDKNFPDDEYDDDDDDDGAGGGGGGLAGNDHYAIMQFCEIIHYMG